MKKIVQNMFIVVMIFLGVIIGKSITANAATYNEYPAQTNVSPWKAWSVKFNKDVSLSSAQNNIAVYDSSDNIVPTTISIGNRNNIAVIQPRNGYTLGSKYYMVIKSTISTLQSSKNLNSDVRMYFTIKTQLDPSDYNNGNSGGIPNVTGLIIVGRDRAYSVSYLLQHADIANDINGNTSKKIYYISDPNNTAYEAVKNLFGDLADTSSSTMGDLRTNKAIDDIVTYTDALGRNYQYVWNDNTLQYELQTPGVNVIVNSPSTTGSVSITVDSVNAISGGKFYKIDGTNIIRAIGNTAVFASIKPIQKIYILSSDQTQLGYAYVDISVQTTISNTFPVTIIETPHGNTGGNSNNNGSVVLDATGAYTYYLNTGDNNSIYKTDSTGEFDIKIGLDKAQYMNEQSGWIYYSNYSDNQKIYRIKTDGSRRERVCDDSAAYLVVSGDWIYYSNHSQQGRLYKIGVSAGASNKDEIQPDPSTYTMDAAGVHGLAINTINSSQIVPYDEVAYINVVGNWIYYVNNSDEHKIYKIDIAGNFRTKVNDEWSACPQVVNNDIYYCSKIGEIMKISTNGTSGAVDLGEQADDSNLDRSLSINVSGDWIYYSNKKDNRTLYKVKNDGSGERYKLTSFPIYYVEIAGDKIYIDSTSNIIYTLPITTTGGDTPIPVGRKNNDNQIVKVNDITKVVDYEDVDQPIAWLEDKYLPDKVTAVMKDNKQQELVVSWDTANKTFKGGIYYYKGIIIGYDKVVNLKLIIPSQMLNGTNDIKIINNPGIDHDVIKVCNDQSPTVNMDDLINKNLIEEKMKKGDIIRVYGDASKTYLLGTGTADSNSSVVISKLNLDLDSSGLGAIYLTIQRSGKYESDVTKVLQMDAPTMLPKDSSSTDTNINDNNAQDNDNIYLGVTGRDFTIYGWNEARWRSDSVNDAYDSKTDYNNMYIIPSTAVLDMSNNSVTPIGVKTSVGGSISPKMEISSTGISNGCTGINFETLGMKYLIPDTLTRDSLNRGLVGGIYSIYVSRHYTSTNSNVFVTADPNGSRPIVTGEVATINPATEQTTWEGVPSQPTITGPNKIYPGNSNNIMVTHGDSVTLKKPISSNEQIWFVPKDDTIAITKIRGWLAGNNQNTAVDNMENLYTAINGLTNGILRVDGSSVQNNFNIDNLDPGSGQIKCLSGGKSYYVFVLNDVGTSLQATQYITADFTIPTLNLNAASTTFNGVPEYSVTNTGTSNAPNLVSDSINITYGDASIDGTYSGSPGTIYIVPGNITNSIDLTTIKFGAIKSISVSLSGTLPAYNASQFNTSYYTIFAVDAAGNISSKVIYINNPFYNNQSGGNS